MLFGLDSYEEASAREKVLFSCSEQSDSGDLVRKRKRRSTFIHLQNQLDDNDSGLFYFVFIYFIEPN